MFGEQGGVHAYPTRSLLAHNIYAHVEDQLGTDKPHVKNYVVNQKQKKRKRQTILVIVAKTII